MEIKVDYEKFRDWLRIKKLSDSTIYNYLYYYEKFNFNFTNENILALVKRYNNTNCKGFIKNIKEYISLSGEYDEEEIEAIKLIEIPKVTGRKKKRYKPIITEEEVLTIMRGISDNRYQLMLLIQFYGGLRRGELFKIRYDDFIWEEWLGYENERNLMLRVSEKGKTGYRKVMVPNWVAWYIWKWCQLQGIKGKDQLWNITPGRWVQVIKKAGNDIIGKDLRPHILRRSCITELLQNKKKPANPISLQEVQSYAGHSNIRNTLDYLGDIPPELTLSKVSEIYLATKEE